MRFVGFLCFSLGACAVLAQGEGDLREWSRPPDHAAKPVRRTMDFQPSVVLARPRSGEAPPSRAMRVDGLGALAVVRQYEQFGGLQVIRVPEGESPEAFVQRLRASGRYAYVEKDQLTVAHRVPNDPEFSSGAQWALSNLGQNQGGFDADIDGPETWDVRTDSSSVVVAIIDSGAYLAHPDLAANLWTNPGESGNGKETNGVDDDGNGYIDDVHGINALVPQGQPGSGDPNETQGEGHGTAVAGIIGAVGNNNLGVAGVSWKASLMPLKFRASATTGTVSDAIECMHYALSKGAKVINASYGFSEYSQAEFEVIQRLRDAGVLVVASAGNGGFDNALFPVYPASHLIENVVAVAASTRNDQLSLNSNYGSGNVDLAAPGVAIRTLGMSAETPLATVSGSSFAAAHVSGAVALLCAQFPSDLPSHTVNRLLRGAEVKAALQTLVHTGGRLNVSRALDATTRPFNDGTSEAGILWGSYVSARGSTFGALRQSNEPQHAAPSEGGGSVWWVWNAPDTATYRIDTLGSAVDTRLAVYTGNNIAALTQVAANDNDGDLVTSQVTINAIKGTTYAIAVESRTAPGGLVILNLTIPLTNDSFSSAAVVSGLSFRVAGNSRGASPESGEPVVVETASGRSVWYKWVAPKSRRFQASIYSDDMDSVLGVYSGTSLKTLVELDSDDDAQGVIYDPMVTFDAIEGRTYYFLVDSVGPGGNFIFSLIDSEWQSVVYGPVYSSPVAHPGGGALFVDYFGGVAAVNALGEMLWSDILFGYGTYASAAAAPDGTLIVVDSAGRVESITADGAVKWSYTVTGAVEGSPAIGPDGTIYARGTNGPLHAINPDGTRKWLVGLFGESYTSPTVARDGTVYIASTDRILRAYTPAGVVKWTLDVGGEVYTSPAIDNSGVLYLGTLTGRFVAVNPDGTLKWQYALESGTSSSPALGENGTVYFGTYDGKVVALNPDGTLRWATKVAAEIRTSSPAVASDGSIYIGTLDGTLVALNSDGTLRRTYYTAQQVRSSPLIHGGMLYFGGGDFRLYAIRLDLDEASSAWPMFRHNSRRTGSPVDRPLRFSLQPRPARVSAGGSVTLATAAAGADTLRYQWRNNGIPIPGATSSTLILNNLQSSQSGVYTVVVTDSTGSLSSEGATVIVDGAPLPAGNASRLANLSVRSSAGQGDRTLIVGFSVQQGPKSLLIRGIGPALAAFGVPGTVPNPRLEVIGSSSQVLDRNDNWLVADAARFLSVGAFALPPGSKDAALVTPVFPGAYSAKLDTAEPGVALVELYDLDPPTSDGGPRLVNVSARSQVGTGGEVLIAGFVIVGDGPRRILVRAVGPTLGTFGVAGVLADPTLELYRGDEKVATNDNWDTDDGRGAGAFPLAAGSKDAVIVRTLQPGAYSAKVSGVGETTGVALIEVYEW